jgi:acyl-coenzyme A synthetase/AMP-(fatty) acid ligase
MNRSQNDQVTLRGALTALDDLSGRFVLDAEERVPLSELAGGSALYSRGEELAGRSVLLATRQQLTTAAALIELDGIARRIVICPPDMPITHFPHIIDTAEIDAIVSDRNPLQVGKPRPMYFSPCARKIVPGSHNGKASHETEWVLLTSGTTGLPKLVVHTLASLTGAIAPGKSAEKPVVWSTFYDIRRYGGLQIFLRAILTGTSLVLSESEESTADFLARAGSAGVTHISGTPSQWRRALMSSYAHLHHPEYVRLSGEAADQAVLNSLRNVFPRASIVHAFASTEAGVAFEVKDCAAGFPLAVLSGTPGVEMKIEEGTLRIRSNRTASRYLGDGAPLLKDSDGFVDTGDLVEMRGNRVSFVGRRDGVINVGGLKVYPEEVEAVINRHPEVQMSLVRARKSPVTGSLVVADIVLKQPISADGPDPSSVRDDVMLLCRESLSAFKVPSAINVVPMLAIGQSGKVMRQNA